MYTDKVKSHQSHWCLRIVYYYSFPEYTSVGLYFVISIIIKRDNIDCEEIISHQLKSQFNNLLMLIIVFFIQDMIFVKAFYCTYVFQALMNIRICSHKTHRNRKIKLLYINQINKQAVTNKNSLIKFSD